MEDLKELVLCSKNFGLVICVIWAANASTDSYTIKGYNPPSTETSTLCSFSFELMATDQPELSVSDELVKLTVDSKRAKSPSAYRKSCDLCHTPNDVLVRCQIDETCSWHFVCTKKCWKDVSGGIVDGDSDHPYYRYGGMWKNKHAGVSAKKPKPKR